MAPPPPRSYDDPSDALNEAQSLLPMTVEHVQLSPMPPFHDGFLTSPRVSISLIEELHKGKELSEDADEEETEPNLLHEMNLLMVLVYPIVITYVLEFLPGLVCIILVGHIDSPYSKQYVDAATLSTMWMNVSALSIGFGLSTALDTLCSQAFGAQRYMKIGIYLQSGIIVVGACFVPVFLLNWYTEDILLLMGQDDDVARFAGEFSRYTVFGMPFLFAYEMIRKVLQAQNIVRPFIFTTIVGNSVNIFGGYYLAYHTSMGFHGAALSRTLGNMMLPLMLVPYFLLQPNYRIWWPGWNVAEAWKQVPIFLKLGIPGLLMLIMQWWAYEIMAIMAGVLPDGVVSISAHAVLMNVASSLFTVFLGISVACNVRVGNYMGANKPKRALLITKISLVMVFCIGCVFSTLIFFFRYQIPKLVINDPASIERAATALLVFIPYELIDGVNGVTQGLCRGVGWQDLGAKINGLAFYLIGIPLGALMAFVFHWDVEGLWIGFGTGIFTSSAVCLIYLFRASWQQLSDEARARTAI